MFEDCIWSAPLDQGDGKRSKVVAGRTRKAGVDKKVAVGADNPSR